MSTNDFRSYIVNVPSLDRSSYIKQTHDVEPSCGMEYFPLATQTGLQRLPVNIVRVAPGKQGVAMHWHSNDEEWTYILHAGPGAVLRTWDEDAGETAASERPIKTGDFIAYPAGVRRGHAIRAGEEETVYLCGGERPPLDMCTYPESGVTMFFNLSDSSKDIVVQSKDISSAGH
jgi:uncharacterized cupin superfamily protein